jgi:hypothetical protein
MPGSVSRWQQLLLGDQLALAADEDFQHAPLCVGQVHLDVAVHLLHDQVDGERRGPHDRFARLRPGRRTAERGTQARRQLVHAERLGHVVVRPGVERADLARGVRARGQHD